LLKQQIFTQIGRPLRQNKQTLHGAEFDGTTRAPTFKPPFTSNQRFDNTGKLVAENGGRSNHSRVVSRFQTFRSVPQVNALLRG